MSTRHTHLSRFLLSVPLLLGGSSARQSGRGVMHGYVAFDDVSYNEVTQGAIHAKVELHGSSKYDSTVVLVTNTDNKGAYDFASVGMGEYTLTISAPDHVTFKAAIYIPSDFECRLATILKRIHLKGSSPR